jgi:hypothetical protein
MGNMKKLVIISRDLCKFGVTWVWSALLKEKAAIVTLLVFVTPKENI